MVCTAEVAPAGTRQWRPQKAVTPTRSQLQEPFPGGCEADEAPVSQSGGGGLTRISADIERRRPLQGRPRVIRRPSS